MLEIPLNAARRNFGRISPRAKRLVFRFPPGLWIAMAVCLLVGGRYAWIRSGRPPHLKEIAAAYGATRLIYGVPQPDPEGKRITYSQMSDRGTGVFLQDISTGQKRLIHEKLPTDDEWRTLDVWPWSPDGHYFLYTHANLFVCDTHSSNAVTELRMEGGGVVHGTWRNGVVALAWLSPTAFVYVSKTGNLHWFQNQNGRWGEKDAGGIKAGAAGLTALSTNTVAWHSDKAVWSLNLETRALTLLSESKVGQIVGLNSCGVGRFLINCTSNGVDSLWELAGASISGTARWQRLSEPATSTSHSAAIGGTISTRRRNVAWLAEETMDRAYLVPDLDNPDNTSLIVLHGSNPQPIRLFERGKVDGFVASPKSQKLFVVGAINNEPSAGIWMFDGKSGDLKCVTSYTDCPSQYAKREPALHGQVFSASGRRVDFFLYRPTDFNRHSNQKYPLVIGDTLYRTLDPEYQNRVHGPSWAPMLANCGAYVVIVERPTWMNGIREWAQNVEAVYKNLVHDMKVDSQNVFLYATSMETVYLSELVEKNPEPWKGILLLNPSRLPDLTFATNGTVFPDVLITAGREEHGSQRFESYRSEAKRVGAQVNVYEHAGSGHWLLGKTALDERSRAMVDFVFNR